ncbi:MAG: signal peptide peptidase SppA [Candidatus Amulumruptor caecigallinarius]|nr:signal peptide peptidase SppA [Candidatus Amulumruptor caecigallinarius]
MLKRFFLNLASSFVGAWIALALFGLTILLIIIAFAGKMAMTSAVTEKVKSRSILKIELNGMIEERQMALEPDMMQLFNGNLSKPQTLDVLVESIREAAENDDILCIYLKCGAMSASPATANALRHELMEFKKSGKKIYAYGDALTQGCYYIASVADKIYLNPSGQLELHGLGGTTLFFKDLCSKLGVNFQVVKVGTFKSAVEPYILSEMSGPARAQLDTLYGNIWGYMKRGIAEARKGVTPQKLDSLISRDFITFEPAATAVKAGLVDSLIYEHVMNQKLADLSGKSVEKMNFVSPSTLVSQTPWSDAYSSKHQIAVLFAVGEIADGNNNAINYETLVPQIIKLADDDNVKGLVLRVNSPGGSAFGSDQIGEALDYFKSKGKPLAVSMGDYAASGGYWISAGADKIFADPLTITGSIGIFGLIPNFKGTLNMLGVNPQMVATNPEANFPTGFEPMNEEQLGVMQKYVDRGYEQFVYRVAKGRHMSVQAVKRIAEGRVWDAMNARKIGLVDSLAYLQNAIEWTAAKAKIANKYDVAAYPEIEPGFWDIVFSDGSTMAQLKEAISSHNTDAVKLHMVRRILSRKHLQAKMPEISVKM